jgi:hypothetical protein
VHLPSLSTDQTPCCTIKLHHVPSRPSFPGQGLSPGTSNCLPQQAGAVLAPIFVRFLLSTLAAHPGQTTSATSWQGTGRLLDKTTSQTAPAFHTTPHPSPISYRSSWGEAMFPFFPGRRRNQADARLGPPLGADEDAGLHPSLSKPSRYSIQILSLVETGSMVPVYLSHWSRLLNRDPLLGTNTGPGSVSMWTRCRGDPSGSMVPVRSTNRDR